MTTECSASERDVKLDVGQVGTRRVQAEFTAEHISSDGGCLLLEKADDLLGLTRRMAACFVDRRDPERTEHSVQQLVAQRVYGLVLGHEDLNDHAQLSRDTLLATAVGKGDPQGARRRQPKDRGQPLASPASLGRLEHAPSVQDGADSDVSGAPLGCDTEALAQSFVETFIAFYESQHGVPTELVLDADPTDLPLHGRQQGRFYHGYYRHDCYLPMMLFCGPYPLAATLRTANIDGCAGITDMLGPIVARLRAKWPEVQLTFRGDGAFCREEVLSWLENHTMQYAIGMAKNARLKKLLAPQMLQASAKYTLSGQASRSFARFSYRTKDSWSRSRSVVGKAEHLAKGENPRFVVTNIPESRYDTRALYEAFYCARGEMENRIKEQLSLFADRMSSSVFATNQRRLWFSMAAHWLVLVVREVGLSGTVLAKAQAPTLRSKLFKLGALVTVSVRRVWVRFSRAFAYRDVFAQALRRLQQAALVT